MSQFNKRDRRGCLAAGVASAIALTMAMSVQADTAKFNLDIKGQKAGPALVRLGEESGVQIIFPGKVARTIDLDGISGNYTVGEALAKMLNGSGLTFEFTSESTIVIKEQNSPESPDNEVVDEEVVVTGSRLRNVNPTSAVTVITMESVKARGINSVEGIIRDLPQNYAGINQTSALDNSSSVGTLGNAAANLRGMGVDGTLILVNGRRAAGSTVFSGSVVNLNTIPFSAIERVEVLTDGASAIYGSDAVAGVINFILRKGYEVEEVTTVRYDSGRNGGDSFKFEQSFGNSWGSGSLSGTVSYEETDPVLSDKIGWTTQDQRSRGGEDSRWTLDGPARLQPGAIFGPDEVIDLHDLYPAFYPPGTLRLVAGPLIGAVDPNRDASQPITLADISPDNLAPYDRVREHQSDKRNSMTMHLRVDQEITEWLSGYAEISYARNESEALRSPLLLRGVTVPTSNAFNDTGQDISIQYTFDGETAAGMIPFSTNMNESRNKGFTLGFNADLPFGDWQAEGYANFSAEKTYVQAFDGINEDALDAALADSNADTALNLFGDGTQQNPDTVAGLYMVSDHPFSKPTNTSGETTQFNISANGSLFSLPGGNVAAVLAIDHRNEYREYDAYIGTTLTTKNPERDTVAVFSELNIPVIGEGNSLPLVDSFEVRLAARWEEYSIEGPFEGQGNTEKTFSNTSPTIGFAWYMTPQFKIRANRGESFKVPRLSQLFGFEEEPRILGYVAGVLAGQGITHDPVSGQPMQEFGFASGGNPDVRPETSDTTSYGFDWTPSGALEGLFVSVNYSEIETEDVIGSSFSLMFRDGEQYLLNSVARNPDGTIAYFQSKPVNFSFEGVKAIDLNAVYDFDTTWGTFQYGFAGTYTKERYNQFLEDSEREYNDGQLNGPDRVKFRHWLTWSAGMYGSTLTMNYVGGYDNPTGLNGETIVQAVPRYMTYDLTGYYEMDNGWKFSGGSRNLLDNDFPFLIDRTPFDPRRVDIQGRTLYLEVSKSFDLI